MANVEPFERFTRQYEDWFDVNKHAYEAEVQAVRALLPQTTQAVEVGVGSGRFAAPLGIKRGVEPSAEMRNIARTRGIDAVDGVAESLPYADGSLDLVLMVTTLCFLDDIDVSFGEAFRVLVPTGYFVIGFVDRDSPIGQLYERNRDANPFYKVATFYSVQQVLEHLQRAGFSSFRFVQTIFHDLEAITEVERAEEGYGKGAFVVVQSRKDQDYKGDHQ
jgi:SAM-dependent methyltransferase